MITTASPAKRVIGWLMVGGSLLLHLFTVICFARQPDQFAAFTVLPIWFWGGIGLLLSIAAFYFLNAPLSLVTSALWCVTVLFAADETRALSHMTKPLVHHGAPPPFQGKPTIRILTVNCAMFGFGSPAPDIVKWKPDIILLQEAHPYQVRQIADAVYQGHGDYRHHNSSGIITRWKIQREIRNPQLRNQQVTITIDGGTNIEVVNIHLNSAATDLRFWERSAWREHRINRANRLVELNTVKEVLKATTSFPNYPTILGGDFNAPTSDPTHLTLQGEFENSFSEVGRGWGDTFHRRFAILRIDHIYATPHFVPVRSRAVSTRHSDHRMVISDFVVN